MRHGERVLRLTEQIQRGIDAINAEIHQSAGLERGVKDIRQAAREVRIVL